jgi:Glycine zipper
MRIGLVELLSLLVIVVSCGCRSSSYAGRGAGLGAVAGALGGAAIGQRGGDAASGALIGTAVGAITGAAIGDTIDQEAAHSAAIIEQRMGRRIAGAATSRDVIAMSQAGLSDDVIATHIRANGVANPLGVHELITLRDAGVSDFVIQTMQQTPPPGLHPVGPPVVAHPGPVIIEEYHYPVAPPVHHGGVNWGVSFGH